MEQLEIEMHVTLINNIFRKNPGRFMTLKDITNTMKDAEWLKIEHIIPALEKMIQRGQLEHDQVYGYCRKGEKNSLRRDIAEPPITRSDFDKLTPAERMEYCKNGGRIAG